MIPEETIARIRESLNLAELVREHVPTLKKRGRNFMARCPFHEERTPSFNVNPEMGVFKCFGCGVGGDAFKFLMLTEGLSYPEAIRKLAARVGVTIETDHREDLSADARQKQDLYGLLEDAATFYHRHLMESQEAEAARLYLAKRGLTPETLRSFLIGFAPASGCALRDAASRKGWPIDRLEKAGLVRRKEGGDRIYDAFWNRIIFPITDVQGRTVAFGGRAMGDAMPKYINSSETPVYSKSRHLYGLFQGLATLRKERHAVILEGYMDVVTCHQYGLLQTMATLGTALTEDHVRILRRYADRVTLLFDPDAAGAQATLRGGELLVADGFTVDTVTLPGGLDPDEILVKEGHASLMQYLEKAMPFMDYFIAAAQKRHPGYAPETKLAIAQDVLPVIHKIKDPLLQDEYLGRLANVLRVEKSVLGQQMKRMRLETDRRPPTPTTASAPSEALPGIVPLEEELLVLFLRHPSDEGRTMLDSLAWRTPPCAEVWKMARTQAAEGTFPLADLLGALPENTRDWLSARLMQDRQYTKPAALMQELMESWRKSQEHQEWQDLKQDIDAMIEGRLPQDAQKIQHYNSLSRRLKGSKPDLNISREASLHG